MRTAGYFARRYLLYEPAESSAPLATIPAIGSSLVRSSPPLIAESACDEDTAMAEKPEDCRRGKHRRRRLKSAHRQTRQNTGEAKQRQQRTRGQNKGQRKGPCATNKWAKAEPGPNQHETPEPRKLGRPKGAKPSVGFSFLLIMSCTLRAAPSAR